MGTNLTRPRGYAGIFCVAFATLLYEIALVRVLSFVIWHYFGYIVISVALLGFGASGTFAALKPKLGEADQGKTLSRLCLLACGTGAGFLVVVRTLSFEPMNILNSTRDLGALLLYEIGAAIPFFFAGLTVSILLRTRARDVNRLYFWDLVGAGAGCGSAVSLMNLLTPPGALLWACVLFAVAAAILGGPRALKLAVPVGVTLAAMSFFAERVDFPEVGSKSLALHIHLQRMEPVYRRWSAIYRTDVVRVTSETPKQTGIHDWGASRLHQLETPIWGFVTHDGSAGTAVYDLRRQELDSLDYAVIRAPYLAVAKEPQVLVIGVGGGRDVLAALRFGASRVTGVELDANTVAYIRDVNPEITKHVFQQPKVTLVAGEGRHYVQSTTDRYDVIQLSGVDTLSAQSQGAFVLAENYLYTTEAMHTYLDHLRPHGVISILVGDWVPGVPTSAGRMVTVARKALEERGVLDPERHIIAIASNTFAGDVMVSPQPFEPAAVAQVMAFMQEMEFSPLIAAGLPGNPTYHALVQSSPAGRQRALDALPFLLYPVTDDNPFFFRMFRWSELFNQTDFSIGHTSALGQVVLVCLLVSLFVLATTFILLPLVAFRKRKLAFGRAEMGIIVYFVSLGSGFMLLEISLMQRLVLYLGYPTYALSVVLFALLVFLGCGSFLSERLIGKERRALPVAFLLVGVVVLAYRFGLPAIERTTLGTPLYIRIAISLVMLAPLGIALGIFFPIGIRRAERIHVDLVPWAWSANGCASVTASVLATVVAMSVGFSAVWALALCVYAVGIAAFLGLTGLTGGSLEAIDGVA